MATSKPKRPKIVAHDINEWAARLTEAMTGQKVPADLVEQELAKIMAERAAKGQAGEKNPAAVALGRLGGLKGGKARADALSAKERSKIAEKAAKKRWEQRDKVWNLIREGKTAKQIANEVGLDVSAIERARETLRKKLLREPQPQ